ncbi:MAG TPA: hypothetical protein ENN03_02550 [bacterium]|nr:hypothetical protein [bacterium]
MLIQGLEFTIVGMLVVFVFLFILVVLMGLTASFVRKLAVYLPEEEPETESEEYTGIHIAAAVAAVTVYQNQS